MIVMEGRGGFCTNGIVNVTAKTDEEGNATIG
jgi:hypothetical protein